MQRVAWLASVVVVFAGTACSGRVPSTSVSGGDDAAATDADTSPGDVNPTNPANPTVKTTATPPATTRLRYPATQTLSPITADVVARLSAIAAKDTTRHEDMFMKVGDSITESYAVMSCLADPATTALAGYASLEPIIDFYRAANVSGPSECDESWCANAHTALNRRSYAARGGSTSDYPLAPNAGQTPLDEEDAIIKPRVALIEFGTNDSSVVQTPADFNTYYVNMQALLTAVEERGMIPVLYTVPPRDPSNAGTLNIPTINAIVRVLAQSHAIPLIDFYRESLPLPKWGLWDGTHPTQADEGACQFDATSLLAGYNVRNLLSVQTLARLRSALTSASAPDADAKTDGDGSAAAPFAVDALPFADSAATGPVSYHFAPTTPTRVRAIAFSARGDATVSVNGGAAAQIVQLTASAYDVQVRGNAFDLIMVACDAADPLCD